MKSKNNNYEFKGATRDEAVENGLKELNLTEEEADIEVLSYGGFLSKATVRITPKAKPQNETVAEEEEIQAADAADESGFEALTAEAKDFVEALMDKMRVNCTVTAKSENGEIGVFINGADANVAIGYRGEVLDAIQFLALTVVNKERSDYIRVQVDAAGYRARRRDTLVNLANKTARTASKSGKSIALEPMNPSERRIIHTALSDSDTVSTESEGEGRYRHVVVIPKNGSGESYGTNTDFRKKGPGRTKSFGYNNKKF